DIVARLLRISGDIIERIDEGTNRLSVEMKQAKNEIIEAFEKRAVQPVTVELGVELAPNDSFRNIGVRPNRMTFRIGDTIRLLAYVNSDCHLVLANIGTDGESTILFPNTYQKSTRLTAGQWHKFPPSAYSFPIIGPIGREKIIGLASAEYPHPNL